MGRVTCNVCPETTHVTRCCSKLMEIDVRDCALIGPKDVDSVNMLLPTCDIMYLQRKAFTGH